MGNNQKCENIYEIEKLGQMWEGGVRHHTR